MNIGTCIGLSGMAWGGGLCSMGRKRIYSDPEHEALREKVAKHRNKHKDKYRRELDERLLARRARVTPRLEGWLIYEVVDDAGEVIRVVIRESSYAPDENMRGSKLLPSSPVARDFARLIARAHRDRLGLPQHPLLGRKRNG